MDVSNQDWMSALPEESWDIPSTESAIPGSHDAMSYCSDITSPSLRSESDLFRLSDGLFYCFTRPVIFKWATTQDKNIEEQSSKGIRFFDSRVAHKPNDPTDDLYFTHVIYTHSTVSETSECVAYWSKSHPKEVVISACSHFEGMDDERHELFISCLKKSFGPKSCPRKEPVSSSRSLWASGYQVISSYDSQLVARHPQSWPAIPYWWANKDTAQEVIRYSDWNKDIGRPEGFFVSGSNLTAPRAYIAKNPKESSRTSTFSNWECLRKWSERQKPGSDPNSLNIIAGDFVGPLPLCSSVIGLNNKSRAKSSTQRNEQC